MSFGFDLVFSVISLQKINAKNAFALHLIDYMKVMVRQAQKEDNTTNFQVF